jgi:hypothetical protein
MAFKFGYSDSNIKHLAQSTEIEFHIFIKVAHRNIKKSEVSKKVQVKKKYIK